jgi:hypothetical protein
MLKSATPRGTVLTATLMLVAQVASAQEPVHSFQELSVKAGQQIVVKPNDGRTSTWIVVSTAGDQLQVERRRWTFKIERRVFTEQSAARIDLRDSTLNGLLIGTGVGLLGAVVIEQTCRDLACLVPFVLSIGMGPGLGMAIDATVNRTIYTPNQGTRVTFSPEFGSRRLGLNARIRFGSRP